MDDRMLRIGSTFYDVRFINMHGHGESDFDFAYIHINPNNIPERIGRTLLHEIIHMGLAEYCQIPLTEEQEEAIVRALEHTFAGLAKDEIETLTEINQLMGEE